MEKGRCLKPHFRHQEGLEQVGAGAGEGNAAGAGSPSPNNSSLGGKQGRCSVGLFPLTGLSDYHLVPPAFTDHDPKACDTQTCSQLELGIRARTVPSSCAWPRGGGETGL